MKKPYDRKDNETYDIRYSTSMAKDIEVHMCQDEKASSVGFTYQGKAIRGHFNTDSLLIARNNVLHFESATTLGLKNLKHMDMETLIPLSLMKRYEHKLNYLSFIQKTPIFFNVETEKFALAMDNRVLRDMQKYPEFEEDLKNIPGITVQKGGEEGNQILLQYETLNDLYKDTSKIFNSLKECYLKKLLEIYPTEDVILVKYNMRNKEDAYFKVNGYNALNLRSIFTDSFDNVQIGLEFIKARKISDDHFYFYNKEGELLIQKSFLFDKNEKKEQHFIGGEDKEHFFRVGDAPASLLVLPYSEKDWNLLTNIKNNLDQVFGELDVLLLQQKTSDTLDKPITGIHQALENHGGSLMLGHQPHSDTPTSPSKKTP